MKGDEESKGNEDVQEGIHEDMGIKKKGQENVLDVHMDQKKSKKKSRRSRNVQESQRRSEDQGKQETETKKGEAYEKKVPYVVISLWGIPRGVPKALMICGGSSGDEKSRVQERRMRDKGEEQGQGGQGE